VKIGRLLRQISASETALAGFYRETGARHAEDHDVFHLCHTLAAQCESHAAQLAPFASWDGGEVSAAPGAPPPKRTGAELLDDLSGLFLAAEAVAILWIMAAQAAQANRDRDLLQLTTDCHTETDIQAKALVTHIKNAAPQLLTVE
jgi:hypothetical protein